MTRLETLSPRLATLFALAPVEEQFAVLRSVCRSAASTIPNCDLLILEALSHMESGPSALKTEILQSLRDRLDEEYFELQQKSDPDPPSPTALAIFSHARLASALALASTMESERASSEALYEALSALPDSCPTIRDLEVELEGAS